MSRVANGVALVGRVLAWAAVEDPCTVTDLARHLGATRTTIFAVVRDLVEAGLLDRDARGFVLPGQASGALGFAYFGLASLAGPTEALLPALRDDTDGHVELVVRDAGGEIVLAQRSPAGWTVPPVGEDVGTAAVESSVDAGCRDVVLRLHLRPQTPGGERAAARCSLQAVAGALSRSGRSGSNCEDDP